MNKGLVSVAALVVFLIFSVFTSVIALADNFTIVPYYATGGNGDWWQYEYTIIPVSPTNPDFTSTFTVNQVSMSLGWYRQGPWILPDKTVYINYVGMGSTIYTWNESGIGQPPINGLIELDDFIDSPFPGNEGMKAYYSRLPSFNVIGGTFSDILVEVILDMSFPDNSVNKILHDLIDMPLNSGWGVTHVSVLSRDIGEILNIDIDADTGNRLWQYELAACSIPAPAPLPGTVLLLGTGLGTLALYGRRKLTAKN